MLRADPVDDQLGHTLTLATDVPSPDIPDGSGRTEVPGSGTPDKSALTEIGELMAATDARTGGAQRAWSALETYLGLHLEHHAPRHPGHDLWTHPTHRRCTSAGDLRAGFILGRARATSPDLPPF